MSRNRAYLTTLAGWFVGGLLGGVVLYWTFKNWPDPGFIDGAAVLVNSIVGVLIWRTLVASQEAASAAKAAASAATTANSITREQFELERRAWVAVSFKVHRDAVWSEGRDFSLLLSIELENFGQTPAFGIDIYLKCLELDPEGVEQEQQILRFVDEKVTGTYPLTGAIVFPGQPAKFFQGVKIWRAQSGSPPANGVTPLIAVLVRYRTFNGERRFTMLAHHIGSDQGHHGRYRALSCPGRYPASSFGFTGDVDIQETDVSRELRLDKQPR